VECFTKRSKKVNGAVYTLVSPTMKTVTLNGVPYSMNEKQELYMYGTCVCVGKLQDKQIVFADDWLTGAEKYRTEYRDSLQKKTVASMERAKSQFEGIA
jgi:hypothetical protein